MTSTWFAHTTFWSGVRRATVAPRILGENLAVRLKDRFFFPSSIHFFEFQLCNPFLNWRSSTWNKKIPIKFPGRFLNFLQKTTQILRLENIDFDVIRTLNLQRIEPYGYTFVFFSFQQPFFEFLKIVDLSLKWGTFTWKTNPEKVSRPFVNFFQKILISKGDFDFDVIRTTHNLLIWSQTRYRCATKSSLTVIRSGFFFQLFFFVIQMCLSSLNWRTFTWKKIPIKFPGPFLNVPGKIIQFLRMANIDLDVILTGNLLIMGQTRHPTFAIRSPSKTRAIRLYFCVFFPSSNHFFVF